MQQRDREVLIAIARMDAKLDALMAMVGGGMAMRRLHEEPAAQVAQQMSGGGADLFFRQFTAKQNAALQMILRGAENNEIATRLGVSPNTAKVHVRVIAKKLGVNNRVQIAMKAQPYFAEIDDNVYRQVSGGLPKDWDATYESPDRHEYIYRKGAEEEAEE